MNRFYYINELYDVFITHWPRKRLSKKREKEVKKQIEKFMMYICHEYDRGLRAAYDWAEEEIRDNALKNIYDSKFLDYWARKHKHLLKMK